MKSIRVTRLWQRAGVYAVRTQAMVNGFGIPLHEEFDEHDTEDTKYILILDEEKPIATCRLYIETDGIAKIERVCVLESERNKGVGRCLIQEGEKWLKELGIKKVIITSRDEVVQFYEKLGYTIHWDKVEDVGIFNIIYTDKDL
ncbi:MAG TPA: GNAT family N-acetyltransferase [Candidatus Merdenecus merdavium]|nr:GNAT family N-acetyltransferase [Candidatus Merdenecus merdavium]